MSYALGSRSLQTLEGVHPDLVAVVKLAITLTEQDFSVGEGIRSVERQRELLASGKTTTMNSRHLTGHAVDLFPYPVSWDWKYFHPIHAAMESAAETLNVELTWGGDWKKFPDGPHFQLAWKAYPK